MKRAFIASFALGSLMAAAAGLSHVMTPTVHLSEQRPEIQLDKVIPEQFGEWKVENNLAAAIVSPEREALIEKIYTQTLSRIYSNSKGERVMLSIAYGKDQRRGTEVHYPEVCYPAQGFELSGMRRDAVETLEGKITVNRLETNLSNQRYEPVTYWTIIGDQVTLGGTDRRIKELKYGFRGEIADGLVFRVSTIDRDTERAFQIQDVFVSALERALKPADKKWLMGLHS